jgi:hypothetical protein
MGRATQSPGGQEHGANSIAGALKQFGTLVSKIGAPGGVFGAAGSRSLGEAGRYLNIAAGAAGIVGTGQQQGITLGSVLSGATSGAEIGSLFGPAGTAIGAGVGGLLDVIGGLFSHRHRPDYANLTQPALDNSPSDFDYLAYRYRATGSLTSNALNNLGQLPNSLLGQAQYLSSQAPTVQIYVDGVKKAVTQQVTAQTGLAANSRTNAYYDSTRPI